MNKTENESGVFGQILEGEPGVVRKLNPGAMWRLAVAIGMLAATLLSATVPSAQAPKPDEASWRGADIQGRFDIGGGRKMYLECHGRGEPTVILEAGFRNSSGIWHISDDKSQPSVWDGIGSITRVCAYDRPGTTLGTEKSSKTDAVPMPRTGPEIVHDLHALLAAAHVPGPYILVAHSMGGILSRLYATTYPSSVIGLVLIDSLPENIAELLGGPDARIYANLVVQVPDVFKDYKEFENMDVPALLDLMKSTAKEKPLRTMPLVVLARGKPIALPREGLPAGFSEKLERSWRKGELYLDSLIPGSQFVVAAKSEHYIQVEQPRLVVDAVRRELEATRWGKW